MTAHHTVKIPKNLPAQKRLVSPGLESAFFKKMKSKPKGEGCFLIPTASRV